jgi:hypothetical protein
MVKHAPPIELCVVIRRISGVALPGALMGVI